MIYLEAVKQAQYAHEHHESMTPQDKLDYAIALGEWGVFSNRQIASFVGMSAPRVGGVTGKTAHTGGTLKPEALGPIIDLMQRHARGEIDFQATKQTLEAGVSAHMLSRLSGIPQTNLSRWARRAVAGE